MVLKTRTVFAVTKRTAISRPRALNFKHHDGNENNPPRSTHSSNLPTKTWCAVTQPNALQTTGFSREEYWADFIRRQGYEACAEIGVWKGDFARSILSACPGITSYWLIDAWRRLPGWNKPFNVSDVEFEAIYHAALTATAGCEAVRHVLRGTTAEVVDRIPDGSVDFVYVDGDHTLRGITLDMIAAWPKVRMGGAIGGDDCTASAWQHGPEYEPTFVRPWVIYFAEAVRAPVTLLPDNQFLIRKCEEGFSITDLSGSRPDYSVAGHLTVNQPRGRAQPSRLGRSLIPLKKFTVRTLRRLSPKFCEADSRRRFGEFPREITAAGWLFLHVPKAAGTSFSLALYGRSFGHATRAEWELNYPLSTRGLKTVAIVRDPLERFVSAFDYLARGGMNAADADFARDVLADCRSPSEFALRLLTPSAQEQALTTGFHFRRQRDFLVGRDGRVRIDFLIPYDRLDEAQRRMAEFLGRPFELPAANRTAGGRRGELSSDARDIVERLYADDIRLYREAQANF